MKHSSDFKNLVIIKTGESETFRDDFVASVSLGDVFRTTLFLRLAAQFERIYWFTSIEARALIQASESVVVILSKDIAAYRAVLDDQKTLIINLEKKLNEDFIFDWSMDRYIGFAYHQGKWQLKDVSQVLRSLNEWHDFAHKNNAQTWGEKLLLLTGLQTDLKYGFITRKVEGQKIFDIGLNWQVGSKWKSKQLPLDDWKLIENELSHSYAVSWQRGMEDLTEYMNWIASCRLIITTDSLGLHLAIAFGIPVVAYFGPTKHQEIDHHGATVFFDFIPTGPSDKVSNISLLNLRESIQGLLL